MNRSGSKPRSAEASSTTVGALAAEAARALRAAGIEDSRLEAEMLLAGVLARGRLALRADPAAVVDALASDRFRVLVERRLRREPLQYILGEAHFRHLRLQVDQRVLIPRPETEILVDAVLSWAAGTGRWGWVADIGTGSGAIALSLATEGRFARVVATDVSAAALAVAAANAVAIAPERPLELREGPLYSVLHEGEQYDVIIANPPYVAEGDAAGLAPEVREWEPDEALFAKAGGLGVLFALVDGAPDWLASRGLLALEVGAGQAPVVANRLVASGFELVRILPDLAGVERIVLGERPAAGRSGEALR